MLLLLAAVFLYNAWVIPLRSIFPFAQTSLRPQIWLTLDYIGDLICLIDIFVYKQRLMLVHWGKKLYIYQQFLLTFYQIWQINFSGSLTMASGLKIDNESDVIMFTREVLREMSWLYFLWTLWDTSFLNFQISGPIHFALWLQLYFWFGMDATYLRLPRLLRIYSLWEFFERLDAILEDPFYFRMLKTIQYMMYLIHVNACVYYGISVYEGFGKCLLTSSY